MTSEKCFNIVLGDLTACACTTDFLQVDMSLGGDSSCQWGRARAISCLSFHLRYRRCSIDYERRWDWSAIAGGGLSRLRGSGSLTRWARLLCIHLCQYLALANRIALVLDDAVKDAVAWRAHLDIDLIGFQLDKRFTCRDRITLVLVPPPNRRFDN
jgi:hypothetical protein